MNSYKITFQSEDYCLSVDEGTSVKEAIISAGLDFDFPCGGRGSCGKCRIKILNRTIPPTEKETKYLLDSELKAGIHLACDTEIHDNIIVELNSEKKVLHNILESSVQRNFNIYPLLKKIYVKVKLPSLESQKSDYNRLKETLLLQNLNCENVKIKMPVLEVLPTILREEKHDVTVILNKDEIIGIERGDTRKNMLGVAFDIGTTTIVVYLLDLVTGKELATSSALNPQIKFGADVISRITYANQNKDGIKTMQSALLKVLNRLIGDTLEKSDKTRDDVYAITIVGNTCIHHLFLGLTPKYIAAAPYVPVITEAINLSAQELSLNINPCGRVFVLPNIAGFVGADTTAVILATEIDKSEDIKLAIDIGTNGEMVLGYCDKLVACSTAAGPAFEGAQISSGMRGASGAIDHVYFNQKLSYTVIDGKKPQGICGSGLLDTIAGLVELGIINKRGKLLSPDEITNPAAKEFVKYIINHETGNAFLLVPETQTAHGIPIMITQEDITALQLAKGAISAGIKILIDECDVTFDDIKEVLLAGAFGNYMNPRSACAIGLIPKELEDKVKMVGNAAGTGSKLALISRREYERCNNIADSTKYIELSAKKSFKKAFAKGMHF